jgi:hypothetical protein
MIVALDIWFIVALSFFLLIIGLLSGVFLSRVLRQ